MIQPKKVKIALGAILFGMVIGGYFLWYQQHQDNIDNFHQMETIPSVQAPMAVAGNYSGVISRGVSGENIYTNKEFSLRFSYPREWNIDTNSGDLQFTSPDIAGGADYIAVGNKIEATVIVMDHSLFGKNTDYPKGYSTTTTVTIAKEPSVRLDVNYPAGGARFISYTIPLPNTSNKYLSIAISGDPSNFYLLENLVKTLEWLPL